MKTWRIQKFLSNNLDGHLNLSCASFLQSGLDSIPFAVLHPWKDDTEGVQQSSYCSLMGFLPFQVGVNGPVPHSGVESV